MKYLKWIQANWPFVLASVLILVIYDVLPERWDNFLNAVMTCLTLYNLYRVFMTSNQIRRVNLDIEKLARYEVLREQMEQAARAHRQSKVDEN